MGDSENSPFVRSSIMHRSPPSTPQPQPRASTKENAQPPTVSARDEQLVVASTQEIEKFMNQIEICLNEICSISTEGKLNTDQKLRISNLCRKVANGTSSMAVAYQSLKNTALVNQVTLQALRDKQDLSERLQALSNSIENAPKPASTNVLPSFADMVKNSNNNFIRPSNLSSVVIYPNDKLKSSEDTKTLVQKIVNPEQMKLHVRALRKTKNGGVIISTDSKDDIEKLKKTFINTSAAVTVDEPFKRRPRIVIVGVPSALQEQEVYKCIFEQNVAEKMPELSREQFLSSICLSHKSGKKDAESCNYIIEVPALIRKVLISQSRVFVNWSSCPVRDFTIVTRCFKCQQFGHAAKTCKQSDYTCAHCGEAGHSDKDCSKKGDPPKCGSCAYFKKPAHHKTGDPECPARKLAEQRYINTIDYEGS